MLLLGIELKAEEKKINLQDGTSAVVNYEDLSAGGTELKYKINEITIINYVKISEIDPKTEEFFKYYSSLMNQFLIEIVMENSEQLAKNDETEITIQKNACWKIEKNGDNENKLSPCCDKNARDTKVVMRINKEIGNLEMKVSNFGGGGINPECPDDCYRAYPNDMTK